jgi:N-acetylmuramoyl-L-alanine amidase
VVLTRDGDAAVGADRRAEIANRARADVVISLHFDGAPVPGARGATAYCAPAVLGGAGGAGRSGAASTIEALPWRDVALRHAVPARSLAEAVAAALELGGQGPARVVEKLPVPLLGVNAPGILLECATLTAPADRARLAPDGLKALAAAIAAGLETYRRND